MVHPISEVIDSARECDFDNDTVSRWYMNALADSLETLLTFVRECASDRGDRVSPGVKADAVDALYRCEKILNADKTEVK